MTAAPVTKLGGIVVLALDAVTWATTTGVHPYQAIFSVHKSQWSRMEDLIGTETELEVSRGGGALLTVEKLTVLYEVPMPDPHRRGVLVSDLRWRWQYPVIIRDFNMVRKTGDRTLLGDDALPVPVGLQQSVDQFDYMAYSLDEERARWTAKRMVENVLEELEPGNWEVDDWPIQSDDENGQLSIQNITLRDNGDRALGRALANVPGADVYVDFKGRVHVIDTTDIAGSEAAAEDLAPPKASGQIIRKISRRAVRPKRVRVYYMRELELRFDFEEAGDTATSVAPGEEDDMFCENVVPLPDPVTEMADGRKLPQGTWVPFSEAMQAWDLARKAGDVEGSFPWTFETLRRHWVYDLDGALGSRGGDLTINASIEARISMIKQHWRQTFRISNRWMDRLRDLFAWRVGVLDTNTGTRGVALAWSQYTVKASAKAQGIIARNGLAAEGAREYTNVDQYPGIDGELNSKESTQALVSVVDKDLGIIRVAYSPGPFGLSEATYPSMMVDSDGELRTPVRNLELQNKLPIAVGGRIGEATTLELSPDFKIAFLLTGVPSAPNSKQQCHVEDVEVGKISSVFTKQLGLQDGEGPELEVFVPPNSVTARYGWRQTSEARATAKALVGFGKGAANDIEFEGVALPGYEFVNGEREVQPNALSHGAAALALFVDKVEGLHAQTMNQGIAPVGNIRNVQHSLDPTGEIRSAVTFGQDMRPLDAFALQPMSARQLTLGIITAPSKGK